jgi:DNA topoisomerase III
VATLIITEKTSHAKDLRAALGDRFGQILPAEGHLLRLAEPDEVDAGWKSWSCVLLKPDGLYPTRPATQGNKPAKLKAIGAALKTCDRVILATDCDRESQLIKVAAAVRVTDIGRWERRRGRGFRAEW